MKTKGKQKMKAVLFISQQKQDRLSGITIKKTLCYRVGHILTSTMRKRKLTKFGVIPGNINTSIYEAAKENPCRWLAPLIERPRHWHKIWNAMQSAYAEKSGLSTQN